MIEVKNIYHGFDGRQIFKDFNAEFETNTVTCILGKSGCGKTTLLRMIAGLLKPNSGEILYCGKPITGPTTDIFMMHQRYSNFPWKTCIDNVLFPIRLHRKVTKDDIEKAMKMLKAVELQDYANKYPYELSGGMNQRLALARVLLSDPPVILMDEPLSALDPTTRGKMQELILHVKDTGVRNTIIMITHDPEEAKRMADNIIQL